MGNRIWLTYFSAPNTSHDEAAAREDYERGGHTDYEGTILSQSSCPIIGKVLMDVTCHYGTSTKRSAPEFRLSPFKFTEWKDLPSSFQFSLQDKVHLKLSHR